MQSAMDTLKILYKCFSLKLAVSYLDVRSIWGEQLLQLWKCKGKPSQGAPNIIQCSAIRHEVSSGCTWEAVRHQKDNKQKVFGLGSRAWIPFMGNLQPEYINCSLSPPAIHSNVNQRAAAPTCSTKFLSNTSTCRFIQDGLQLFRVDTPFKSIMASFCFCGQGLPGFWAFPECSLPSASGKWISGNWGVSTLGLTLTLCRRGRRGGRIMRLSPKKATKPWKREMDVGLTDLPNPTTDPFSLGSSILIGGVGISRVSESEVLES